MIPHHHQDLRKVVIIGSSCIDGKEEFPSHLIEESEENILKRISQMFEIPEIGEATEKQRDVIFQGINSIPSVKFTSKKRRIPGGGAANMAYILRRAANHFNIPLEISLVTEIGQPNPMRTGPNDEGINYGYPRIMDFFKKLDVKVFDLGQSNPRIRLAFNNITSGTRGRIISKDPEPEAPEQGRLHDDYGLQNELLTFVADADLLIAQASKFLKTTLKVSVAVKHGGGQVILDYDASDKHDMDVVRQLLTQSDYTLAAAEAHAPDRHDNDQGSLFQKLVYSDHEYSAQLTSVTDGIKPAFVNSAFQDWSMEIPLREIPLECNNGSGDSQKSSFALGLLMGKTPEQAFHFASAMSSFGAGYRDFTWLNYLDDFENLYDAVPLGTSIPAPALDG